MTTTVYVLMNGDKPVTVHATREAAFAEGEAAEQSYGGQLRWDDRAPGEYRLMTREQDDTGKGRGRFAWAMRAVYAVAGEL